jgi:hypothetical protein
MKVEHRPSIGADFKWNTMDDAAEKNQEIQQGFSDALAFDHTKIPVISLNGAASPHKLTLQRLRKVTPDRVAMITNTTGAVH